MRDAMNKSAQKLEELNLTYEKDVTNNILKQLNLKEIFKDVNFGDPLAEDIRLSKDSSVKVEEGGSKKAPVAAPFKSFVELQKYLFMNPLKI